VLVLCEWVCMCVCVCVCVCLYMCVYMYIHAPIYVHTLRYYFLILAIYNHKVRACARARARVCVWRERVSERARCVGTLVCVHVVNAVANCIKLLLN